MSKKIAIIAWGAMADVLYATPIVRHIRELHPDDKITWIVRDKFAEVVELNPHVDEIVKWSLPDGFNSRQDAEHVMDAEILVYAKTNFDKFYDLQYWPRYSNFFERPGEDFISLRARNAGLEPSAIKDRSVVSELSQLDIDTAREFLGTHDLRMKPFITVNHISYAASPVCNFEYYQQLTNILKNDGIAVVFTGATNEPIPDGGIDARGISYRVWQALIGMSDFYLGLDSGAKTLACATEVPVAILHSRDFPLQKTGCASMGIRKSDIMELTVIPSVTSLVDVITSHIPPWTK